MVQLYKVLEPSFLSLFNHWRTHFKSNGVNGSFKEELHHVTMSHVPSRPPILGASLMRLLNFLPICEKEEWMKSFSFY